MNMMLGLEFCFTAVVTDNSSDTTDRNQRRCILQRNTIYHTSNIKQLNYKISYISQS